MLHSPLAACMSNEATHGVGRFGTRPPHTPPAGRFNPILPERAPAAFGGVGAVAERVRVWVFYVRSDADAPVRRVSALVDGARAAGRRKARILAVGIHAIRLLRVGTEPRLVTARASAVAQALVLTYVVGWGGRWAGPRVCSMGGGKHSTHHGSPPVPVGAPIPSARRVDPFSRMHVQGPCMQVELLGAAPARGASRLATNRAHAHAIRPRRAVILRLNGGTL